MSKVINVARVIIVIRFQISEHDDTPIVVVQQTKIN